MLYYSTDFKDAVKTLYPEDLQMERWLEDGDTQAVERLRRDALQGINFRDVMNANSLEELQEKVKNLKLEEKNDLYWAWNDGEY